ncbi:MAG: aromatic ring-hydroxylating oxygenase subunit alpha, partial [Archangium sp.]
MRNPHEAQNLALVTTPAVDLEAEADLARCGALKDFWYVACLSTELASGKPLARTLFGTNVVLFRD